VGRVRVVEGVEGVWDEVVVGGEEVLGGGQVHLEDVGVVGVVVGVGGVVGEGVGMGGEVEGGGVGEVEEVGEQGEGKGGS
uniref:hypothetical protein n=1 Tax=Kocuria rhizophila TaxID=72000 RepID=UPI001C92D53E